MSHQSDKSTIEDDLRTLHGMGYAQELGAAHERLLQLRHLVLDHLHPGRRHHLVPAGDVHGRRFRGRDRLARRRRLRPARRRSLGQIASAYPTAGGLYHWSSILGGRGWGWATAWINLLGLIFVVASVNVGVYTLFRDLVVAGVFGIDVIGACTGLPTQQAIGGRADHRAARRCSITSASGSRPC